MKSSECNTKKEPLRTEGNADKNQGPKLAVGAGIGAAVATGAAPAVVAGLGFTAQGIAGGSIAAGMMAAEAAAAGGGVAAGGLVATLQSVGVIGLGIGATGGVALVGATVGLATTWLV
jgi:Interferon-induced 6-16 family